MLFADLVRAADVVASSSARSRKIAAIAELLRRAGPAEHALATTYLSGELRQRQLGVGWASVRDRPPPAAVASVSLVDLDARLAALASIAGPGSARARAAAVAQLFALLTAPEQVHLAGLIAGGVRTGALEGVTAAAVAAAADRPIADIQRALMLLGDLGEVATRALAGGPGGLADVGLVVGRPIRPMLAGSGVDVAAALARIGDGASVEWKLDGVRLQLHRAGDAIEAYTRTLDRVTDRVPEIVAAARTIHADRFVIDAEAIVLDEDGRPRPFQETGARIARRGDGTTSPLALFAFDVLHVDGVDLLDRPLAERRDALDRIAPPELRVPRLDAPDLAAAEAFYADALARGHEGVMVKAPRAPYEAGRRGATWLKVKHVATVELVVLAVEWGSGRRRGLLSNLHLGARRGDGFVMLGKTFKGLTDELLVWQTEQLLARETARDGHVVHVRPELVVEIAFEGLQRSSRYPGGVALRFARVRRYRPDRRAGDADTLERVIEIADYRV